jgi:osmotically inducible lipoprotein OsmB
MNKIALVLLGSLALAACATPQQTVGTTAGAVGGAVVGGPVGAVVGGAVGAVATAPGGPVGGPYRHRCHYHDRYGNVHYGWCRG